MGEEIQDSYNMYNKLTNKQLTINKCLETWTLGLFIRTRTYVSGIRPVIRS